VTLSWEATYAIGRELRRRHPAAEMDRISLRQIHDWTLQLEEFDDDPSLVNDDILYAIFQEWFEENLNDERNT